MKKGIAYLAMFLVGAAVGSGVTYILANEKLEKKYEDISNEEIESVKKMYKKKQEELAQQSHELVEINREKKEELDKLYDSFSEELGYINSNVQLVDNTSETLENDNKDKNIYVISAEQVGENDSYNIDDLTLYSDGVLVNSLGDVVDNPTELLGDAIIDLLKTYNSEGFNVAYIRNDILMTDYTIELTDEDFFNN